MDRDEHKAKAQAFIQRAVVEFHNVASPKVLSDACYTFSELGLLEGIDSLSPELAVRIWALVESVMRDDFPAELKM